MVLVSSGGFIRNTESLLLPTATGTLAAAARLLGSGEFWHAMWVSNQALVLGFPLAAVAGVLLGLALGRSRTLARWLDIHLQILLVVPKTAVIPLIVMASGFGLRSRAIVIFAFALPIIAVTVQAGVQTVDARLIAMARAFSATERQIWWRVLVPAALPGVMTDCVSVGARHHRPWSPWSSRSSRSAWAGYVAVPGRLRRASLYATVLIVMAKQSC